MNKPVYILYFLLPCLTGSLNAMAMQDVDRFNGMQLAFVMVGPGGEVEEKAKPKSKPKSKPVKSAPAKTAPAKPAPLAQPKAAPAVQPKAPAAVVVPAPVAPAPAVKSTVPVAPVPVARPAPVPAPAPVVKPAPAVIVKPESHEATHQPSRHTGRKAAEWEWLFGMGLDVGGEELGTVTYSDGSTASVKANTGLAFNAGTVIPNDDEGTFATQISIGYKTGGPRLWSMDVNWTAIPLEVIEFYRSGSVRMGGGISYQLNPQLKVNLPSASFISKYNNAIGLIAQIGWRPARENYSIDLRYTRINFQSSDVASAPLVDGSVGGLYLNYYY